MNNFNYKTSGLSPISEELTAESDGIDYIGRAKIKFSD